MDHWFDYQLILNMHKLRIYIDTSVVGGYYDDEFSADTKKLFERIKNEDFKVYLSEISRLELLPAPKQVQDIIELRKIVG